MVNDHRNFLIFSKHRRLTRLWQFFFTGWGLFMVAVFDSMSANIHPFSPDFHFFQAPE